MTATLTPLRFIDPRVLTAISNLELMARTVVQGFSTGLHQSPYLGFSLDFAEYQQYHQGDDIRRIDWKVYARTDRLYIKKYRGETNTRCLIMLDCSKSMGYASDALSKFDYGRYLAACLAYFISRKQQDLVGFASFDTKIREYLGPRGQQGHLQSVLRTIDNLELGQTTRMEEPLHQLAERLSRRGLAVVISDLLDERETIMEGIKHLRYQGQDVIVFHILDKAELEFPFETTFNFVDMETRQEMQIQSPMIRNEYLKAITQHNDYFEKECFLHGIDYFLMNTSQPLDFALFSYMSRRSRPRLGKTSGGAV